MYSLFDKLDFSKICTLHSYEGSNDIDWQKSYLLPLKVLDKNAIYSVNCIRGRNNRYFANVSVGNPEKICLELEKRCDNCDQIMLSISNCECDSVEKWLITRL